MKRHQLENIVPLIFSIFSLFVFYDYLNLSLSYLLGVLFVVVGLILWWMGKIALGESFTTLPKASKLVTSGIYSKIRHPIYIGVSLVFVGYLLIMQELGVMIITGIIILILVVRAYLEEKVLLAAFGKVYESYKRKSWF